MVSLKTFKEWLVILVFLLILPEENRLILFDVKPEDWYGEISLASGKDIIVVAKNASKHEVEFNLASVKSVVTLQGSQKYAIDRGPSATGLPESLSIVRAERTPHSIDSRHVTLDSKYYFRPGKMSIFTQSDFYYSYLLIAILASGFMILGFLIAKYGVEPDVGIVGKEE